VQGIQFGDTVSARVLSATTGGGAAPPAAPPLPPQADLRSILTPVRNQAFRGTCVAFATTALLESKMRILGAEEPLDLSEQFVYFVARQNDPDKKEDGTYPHYVLDGLQSRGACTENLLRYNQYNDWGQSLWFDNLSHPLSLLDQDAQQHRINGYTAIAPKIVITLKSAIVSRQAVCIGVPVFRQAWYNPTTQQTGEVQMPLTRVNPVDGSVTVLDTVVGGHAVAVAGYEDTPDPNDFMKYRPGGGYFIFKNSWGTTWAPQNSFGPGFGVLPYDYTAKYNMDAFVVT
jgi:hypothetical protein